jgi:hypothetical protein
VTLERATFDRDVATAILAAGTGTELSATDIVIRDTASRETDLGVGTAVQAKEGAHVGLERGVFARNRTAGFFCDDPGTLLTATDVVVRDTAEQEFDSLGGHGVLLRTGSRAELVRALFERNRSAGLLIVDPDTSLSATDLVIRETRSRASDGGAGDGLQFYGGAQVDVVRAAIERNRRNGIIAYQDVSSGTFEDLVVEDTLEQECVPDCPGFGAGVVAAEGGDHLELTRFRVSGSASCGVQLALGGTMDLHEGVVSDNLIGVNVQTPDFDIGRLQDHVLYQRNQIDFDGTALPIPDPVATVDP